VRTLVLGGVRSGKSRYAEALAQAQSASVLVLATATAEDAEMVRRIEAHRARRPANWSVLEEPIALAAALTEAAGPDRFILIDCLTLWLTNLLCHGNPALLESEVARLVDAWPKLPGEIVAVSNEVGLGIMPINDLARRFADVAGELHQALAAQSQRVVSVVAGIPVTVKGDPAVTRSGP
jgi:adenosylcobinamide kinase / adenosylcobinamide-phosphate guanylyltransferase